MKLKLKRIGPIQAGKMLGAFYALFALLFVPVIMLFMAFGAVASRGAGGAPPLPLMFGMGMGFIIFMPVIYGIMGFIFGCLGALIYNLLAKPLGGFALEFEADAAAAPIA
jgi:hypothetical protein